MTASTQPINASGPAVDDERIAFNRAIATGDEVSHILHAIDNGHLSGDGDYTRQGRAWLEEQTGAQAALLVHSCTAALELAVILAGVEPGDEVIMPSYTFTSTANAVVLRGGVPVFVDVRPDTLNLDERHVEAAITERTKVVLPIHYAGVGCDMERICQIAEEHDLLVVEDAAQGLMASRKSRPLGSIGQLGALSFHETKNVTCGEGGALLINDPRFVERAEILREKGTNRSKFFRGEIDKYTWVDVGSSYVMSDLTAAFLWAQFEGAHAITARRLEIWNRYHAAFADFEAAGNLRRPVVPEDTAHNAHMYYLIMQSADERDALLAWLNGRGINAVFHYVPLHSAPAGRKFGRAHGRLEVTDDLSARLLRLPIWPGMTDAQVDRVITTTCDFVRA